MRDAFFSAVKNLKKKKLRSFLTMLGVSIGVTSVILVGSISQFGTDSLNRELESLGLGGFAISTAPVSGAMLTDEGLELIRSNSSVEQAAPITLQNTKISARNTQTDALLWGVDPSASQIVSIELLHGRMLTEQDIKSCSNVCLIDAAYANKLYTRSNIVGKQISVLCGGTQESFQIVGVVKAGSGLLQNMIGSYIPTFVYVPYTTAQNMNGHYTLDQIAVKVKNGADVDQTGKTIIASLNRRTGVPDGFLSNNLAKQKDQLINMLNIVTLIFSAVGAVSLLVASLSIMTVMLVSVNERTREIGIKKAIGASRSMIMLEFLFESLLLSVFGCMAGIICGYCISLCIAVNIGFFLQPQFNILLLSIGFSLFSGILFGVYPAVKASRLKPVEALRNE